MNGVMVEFFGVEFADPFFIYALPWLLVFALVYGILSQLGDGIPKSDAARAVISIVLAFFSLLFAEPLMVFLQRMGGSAIVILTAFLFFLILVELTKLKGGAVGFLGSHPGKLALVILVIVVVLFLGSGGIELLGLGEIDSPLDPATIFFLVVVALSIWWMVKESEDKGKGGDENRKKEDEES